MDLAVAHVVGLLCKAVANGDVVCHGQCHELQRHTVASYGRRRGLPWQATALCCGLPRVVTGTANACRKKSQTMYIPSLEIHFCFFLAVVM